VVKYPQGSGSLAVSHPTGRVRNVDPHFSHFMMRVGLYLVPNMPPMLPYQLLLSEVLRGACVCLCVALVGWDGWIGSRLVF
jgi:hypothetical protein